MMLWTLAQTAVAERNPGYMWGAAATTIAMIAAGIALSSAVAAWITLLRAIKSSKSAKEAAKDATNQATYANMARMDAAQSLGKMETVWSEYTDFEQKRYEREFKVSTYFQALKEDSSLSVRIFNNSPERALSVREIGLVQGHPPSAMYIPLYGKDGVDAAARMIAKDDAATIILSAKEVTRYIRAGSLATMSGVYFLFEHTDEPHAVQDEEAKKFVDLCRALSQWKEANPRRKENGLDGDWDFRGFEPFGPNFHLEEKD